MHLTPEKFLNLEVKVDENADQIVLNFEHQPDELTIALIHAIGFDSASKGKIYRAAFNTETLEFANTLQKSLPQGQFPTYIPYTPAFSATLEHINGYRFSYITATLLINGTENDHWFLIFETGRRRSRAVAKLFCQLLWGSKLQRFQIETGRRVKEARMLFQMNKFITSWPSEQEMVHLRNLITDKSISGSQKTELKNSQVQNSNVENLALPETPIKPEVSEVQNSQTKNSKVKISEPQNTETQIAPFGIDANTPNLPSIEEHAQIVGENVEVGSSTDERSNTHSESLNQALTPIRGITLISCETLSIENLSFPSWKAFDDYLINCQDLQARPNGYSAHYRVIWKDLSIYEDSFFLYTEETNPILNENVLGKEIRKSLWYALHQTLGQVPDTTPSTVVYSKEIIQKWLKEHDFGLSTEVMHVLDIDCQPKIPIDEIYIYGVDSTILCSREFGENQKFSRAESRLTQLKELLEIDQNLEIELRWKNSDGVQLNLMPHQIPNSIGKKQWYRWLVPMLGSNFLDYYQLSDNCSIMKEVNYTPFFTSENGFKYEVEEARWDLYHTDYDQRIVVDNTIFRRNTLIRSLSEIMAGLPLDKQEKLSWHIEAYFLLEESIVNNFAKRIEASVLSKANADICADFIRAALNSKRLHHEEWEVFKCILHLIGR